MTQTRLISFRWKQIKCVGRKNKSKIKRNHLNSKRLINLLYLIFIYIYLFCINKHIRGGFWYVVVLKQNELRGFLIYKINEQLIFLFIKSHLLSYLEVVSIN
jgi:hypothetical protein